MTSSESKSCFESLLAGHADGDLPKGIISCMIDFYRGERAEDCDLEEDGDMLLFQWGTYDWGEGRYFELNITRQFIVPADDDDEDDEIFQLSVTAKYNPSPEIDSLTSGNKWCATPDDLREFEEFIQGTDTMTMLGAKPCEQLKIDYELVG